METDFAAYLGLLVAAAWCAAYLRHLRETARTLHERLVPALPYGARINVFPRLCTSHGLLAHALSLVLLLFALLTRPMEEAILSYLIAYGGAMLLAYRFFTPPTGASHYQNMIRAALFRRLRREQARDEFRARLLRVALEHLR